MKPIEILEQGRFLGEEFILWLWWRGLTEGGTSGQAGDQSAVYVDDAVQLVTERGDVKTMSLAKGNPAESREAFEALSRGMRPAAARIRILSGDLEWTATLDAAQLRLKGLKMPPSQAKAPEDRVADRLFLLEEGHAHLERRFAAFLEGRVGEDLGLGLQAWVKGALTHESSAPWEA